MDVDGTLTDGKIYMGTSGELIKAFNVKDGCGIHDILIPAGICPIVITGRKSEITLNRCYEIGITDVYQGVNNKVQKMIEVIGQKNLSKVSYIGDDINDLKAMISIKQAGGLVGCPIDAANAVKEKADFISEKKGGDGAVRDFIEWIVY